MMGCGLMAKDKEPEYGKHPKECAIWVNGKTTRCKAMEY